MIELTEKEKSIMDAFCTGVHFNIGGKPAQFFRHDTGAVEIIRGMSDERLIREAFRLTAMIQIHGFSVADLQEEALMWAEMEKRGIGKENESYARHEAWCEKLIAMNEQEGSEEQ